MELDNGTAYHVYGAYSTMFNPLAVSTRMRINAHLHTFDAYRWDVLVPVVGPIKQLVHCNANMPTDLAQMSTGMADLLCSALR